MITLENLSEANSELAKTVLQLRKQQRELVSALRDALDMSTHENECRWWEANISELTTPEARAANDAKCNCWRAPVVALLARVDPRP